MSPYDESAQLPFASNDANILPWSQRTDPHVVESPVAARPRLFTESTADDEYPQDVTDNDAHHQASAYSSASVIRHRKEAIRALRHVDNTERATERNRRAASGAARVAQRRSYAARKSDHPTGRPWHVVLPSQRRELGTTFLPHHVVSGITKLRSTHRRTVSVGSDFAHQHGGSNVALDANRLSVREGGAPQGIALGLYFVLLPLVIAMKWSHTRGVSHPLALRVLLICLGLLWLLFVIQLVISLRQKIRGDHSSASGAAWLAGIVLSFLPFALATNAGATTQTAAPSHHAEAREHGRMPLGILSATLPLVMLSERRRDQLRDNQFTQTPSDVDRAIDVLSGRNPRAIQDRPAIRPEVRVELLRADPVVTNLEEPFTATLRRRCVEMAAYLALHRHEPVTGERLRSRVLTNADVDASLRTLANTASAVRRSLGSDEHGLRLHPVTSSGVYQTHGVTSDIEVFSKLVARARQLPLRDASEILHQGLSLIKGEPLASVLRGFEWFSHEGHAGALLRDGEWAALALHHQAMEHQEFELAFWSLRQGLLLDPYSDVLLGALAQVPRLREFGRDRARSTQHQSISPSRAVLVSWSLASFTNQVTQ